MCRQGATEPGEIATELLSHVASASHFASHVVAVATPLIRLQPSRRRRTTL